MVPTTRMIQWLVLTIAFLVPATVLSEQFHVARDSSGASDNNDGLSPVYVTGNRGPWRTLQHAAYNVVAGDTVLVYSGDYRDEDTGWGGPGVVGLTTSGMPGAPIRFEAAPFNVPLLNTILVHNLEWIEISGFKFVSRDFELPANWKDMPQVVVDDPGVTIDTDLPWPERESAVRQKYATYMRMMDFFLSSYTNSVDVRNSSNIVIRQNEISLYTFGIQVRGNSSQILIEKNDISHCVDGIFTWDPNPAITNSIIRQNQIRQSFNNGMQVRQGASNVLIESNDVRFSGTAHISLLSESADCTIRGNVAVRGGFYTETMVHPGSSAINIHTSRGGIVVEGNYAAWQIDETGLDGNGFIVDLMLDRAGVLLRNNISYRNQGSGIRTVDSQNCVIVNNTLVENGYHAVNPRAGVGVYLSREQDVQQTIVNNIFYGNPAGGIKSFFTIENQKLIDHNLYYSRSGVPFIWDGWDFGEKVYNTMPEIQRELGWEANGVYGNPRFANLFHVARGGSLPDFRLNKGSAALDRGKALDTVIFDLDGRPRPVGDGQDIGAFERN